MSPQTMMSPDKRSATTLTFELVDGELKPYRRRIALGMPLRPGRKSPCELHAISQLHEKAAADIRSRLARSEAILPPPELKSLPLIASYMLYVAGVDLRTKLTAPTLQLHRKLIRLLTDLDIFMPL